MERKTTIVSVVNQKGGCGKTTTAVNLSACLAMRGYKTLLVDLDAQAHASLGLGINVGEIENSVYNVFKDNVEMQRVAMPTTVSNLNIVPSTNLLSGLHVELSDYLGRESILRIAIRKMLERIEEPYTYIIMDCSPALNIITINALTASNYVLVPIQTHYYSLEGMKELFSTIDVVKERLNFELEVLGIVATLFDRRMKINNDMLVQIKEYFGSLFFPSLINMNVKLIEAPIHKKPITVYDPKSRGAEDYEKLTEEFLIRTDSVFSQLREKNLSLPETQKGEISVG